jgi:hypothetical protein
MAGDLPTDSDVDPQAAWSTPGDGRLVMLARNALGFDKPMPFRVRLCVTNFTGANNAVNLFVWTTAGPQPGAQAAAQPQTRHLELGDCVEIDRPAALIVQDATTTGTSSGYYQLFEATPPPANRVSLTTSPPGTKISPISYGPQDMAQATCNQKPPIISSADFYTTCSLALPAGKYTGVRMCIDSNYIKSSDGKTQYAASLLDLIVDKKLLPPQNKPSPYDYNWNPVIPNGCRDIIWSPGPHASEIYFGIGPHDTGGYWDASKVTEVDVTLRTITLNDANR